LGAVAQALNGLLDTHEEARGRAQSRETRLRELLVGCVAADGSPAAVVSLGGDVVASTFTDAETGTIVAAASELRGAVPDDLLGAGAVERVVDCGGKAVRFHLLVVEGKRAVGWSVRSS
ncbi:MAG TPA: hypothetical protein VD788_02875, partial [Candidatus Polarisedimenticolaceae bacterium]|nr:hypothetical protein [Candidatus Polarisedimenticolaceae bacterium]